MSEQLRYEYLFGRELNDVISQMPLAWVPLGILERHGEHLPWGLDGLKAHGICLYLAKRLGGVVLPATHLAGVHHPWDPDPQTDQKMQAEIGNFYLRQQTFRMLLQDILNGLANVGFKMIVLYTGHYPKLQIDIVHKEAHKATEAGMANVIGFDELTFFGTGDHAGKWETSLHLAICGEARLDNLHPSQADRIGFWTTASQPHDASKEFGQQALNKIEAHFHTQIRRSFP